VNVRPEPSRTGREAEPAPPIYFIGGAEPLPGDVTPGTIEAPELAPGELAGMEDV